MPPQRTVPPAKAMKTERTHEENQERAYIAASRRSDRSLEARVESARRASVIHKRRTGRSLRVTEQDVINEEMYEEEDDDLPLHYRRLTAHLQTGSPDFNRRLAAYLTNHVAMRSALDQAITTSYAQQYPNAPQFAHNRTMYTSPMHAPGLASPSSPSSIHRQAPYPSPGSLNYRNGAHGRSQSIATPQEMTSPAEMPAHNRRMSMPQGSFPMPQPAMMASHGLPAFGGDANLGQDFSPFSTALPPESQLLLGPSLDQNDPLTSMLMAGSESFSQPSSQPEKLPQNQQPMNIQRQGLSSTLAPSVLDDLAAPGRTEAGDGSINPELTFNLSAENQKIPSSSQDSNDPLGLETDWNTFINDNSWEHNAT